MLMPPSVFFGTSPQKTSSPADGFAMRGKKFSAKAPEHLLKQIEARLHRACVSMLAGEMPVAALAMRRAEGEEKPRKKRAALARRSLHFVMR